MKMLTIKAARYHLSIRAMKKDIRIRMGLGHQSEAKAAVKIEETLLLNRACSTSRNRWAAT
jgi:hypothetical protein